MPRRRVSEVERLRNWNVQYITKRNRLSFRERISQDGYNRQRLNYALSLKAGDRLISHIGTVPIISKEHKRALRTQKWRMAHDTYRFIHNDAASITYTPTDLDEFRALIEQHYALVMNGERFIVTFEDAELFHVCPQRPHV